MGFRLVTEFDSYEEYEEEKQENLELLSKPQLFVRMGKFGEFSQKFLDSEMLSEIEGGIYNYHQYEGGDRRVVRYEEGVSCYFTFACKDRKSTRNKCDGYVLIGPDFGRASYVISNYWDKTLKFLEPSLMKNEVYLIEGKLIPTKVEVWVEDYDRESSSQKLPTFKVGSDGEPVVKDAKIVSQLDIWGDDPEIPTLFNVHYDYEPFATWARISKKDIIQRRFEHWGDSGPFQNYGEDATNELVWESLKRDINWETLKQLDVEFGYLSEIVDADEDPLDPLIVCMLRLGEKGRRISILKLAQVIKKSNAFGRAKRTDELLDSLVEMS
jgi:hypothetical protein